MECALILMRAHENRGPAGPNRSRLAGRRQQWLCRRWVIVCPRGWPESGERSAKWRIAICSLPTRLVQVDAFLPRYFAICSKRPQLGTMRDGWRSANLRSLSPACSLRFRARFMVARRRNARDHRHRHRSGTRRRSCSTPATISARRRSTCRSSFSRPIVRAARGAPGRLRPPHVAHSSRAGCDCAPC
jgi:hypothetical protein